MCASVNGAYDWCWHTPFVLWVHGNGFASLGHNLHVRMHPLQAPQCPADGLVLGRFGKHAQDRNDTSWVMPLFAELMIGAGTLHLASAYVAMDWQTRGINYMSGYIPFRPHNTQHIG